MRPGLDQRSRFPCAGFSGVVIWTWARRLQGRVHAIQLSPYLGESRSQAAVFANINCAYGKTYGGVRQA